MLYQKVLHIVLINLFQALKTWMQMTVLNKVQSNVIRII